MNWNKVILLCVLSALMGAIFASLFKPVKPATKMVVKPVNACYVK